MLSTAHILTGAAVGTVVANPFLVILISIVLHFSWDAFPHWDPDYEKWPKKEWYQVASMDLLVGFLLAFYIVGNGLNLNVLLGMFASILPDIITMVIKLGKIKFLEPYITFHKKIQNIAKLKYGLIYQVIVVVVAVFIIKMSMVR